MHSCQPPLLACCLWQPLLTRTRQGFTGLPHCMNLIMHPLNLARACSGGCPPVGCNIMASIVKIRHNLQHESFTKAICALLFMVAVLIIDCLYYHPACRPNCCRHISTHRDEACTASVLSTQGCWQEAALTERRQTNRAQEGEAATTTSEGDCFMSTHNQYLHEVVA